MRGAGMDLQDNYLTSRNFYPAASGKNKGVFARTELLPRTWNNGILEMVE